MRNRVGSLMCLIPALLALCALAHAGSHSAISDRVVVDTRNSPGSPYAISGRVTVDTRGTPGAGTGSIAGQVLGGPSRTAVAGATITAGAYSGSSGSDGTFSIPAVAIGSYDVTASASGYQSATVKSKAVKAQTTTYVSFALDQSGGSAVYPSIASVESLYGDLFPTMAGQNVHNTYTAHVEWNGTTPGSVTFDAPNQDILVACASGQTEAQGTFTSMSAAFGASALPLAFPLVVTATSAVGRSSPPVTLYPLVFAVPDWVIGLPWCEVTFATANGGWEFEAEAKFPYEPIDVRTTVPDWVPFIGGEFGLQQTQARVYGAFSSPDRSGKFTLAAATGFTAGGMGEVAGYVGGGIEAILGDQWEADGLFVFGIEGTLRGELGILEALSFVPGVALFRFTPPGAWVNERVELFAEVSPAIEAEIAVMVIPSVAFKSGDFELRCGLTGGVCVDLWPYWVEGYVGAVPYLVLHVPGPDWFKEGAVDFVAGVEAKLFTVTLLKAEGQWHLILVEGGEGGGKGESLASTPQGHWVLAASSVEVSDTVMPIRGRGGASYDTFVGGPVKGPRPLSRAAPPADPLGFTTASNFVLNAYSESHPSLAVSGTQRVLVYTHDDTNKPDYRSTEIRYSRDTGAGWSAPASLTDDTHLDCDARVAFDGAGHAVAVWQRSRTNALTVSNQVDLLKEIEIAYAVMDVAAGTWAAPAFVSTNAWLDHAPRLAAGTNGGLMLAWLENQGNELIGTTNSPSRILATRWDDEAGLWGPTVEAVGTNHGVGLGAFGSAYSGSGGDLVFVRDMDAGGTNAGMSELFHVHHDGLVFGMPERMTDDAVGAAVRDAAPKLTYTSDGGVQAVWVRGTNLVMCEGFDTNALRTVCDLGGSPGAVGFTLARDAGDNLFVIWTDFRDGQFDAYYRAYDSGHAVWGSEDGRLTFDTAMEAGLAPAFGADGKLVVACNQTAVTYTNQDLTMTNGEVVTVGNVPVKGETDVVLLYHEPGTDLQVLGVWVSPTNPVPGSNAVVTVQVENYGDVAQVNLEVGLYDGDAAGTNLARIGGIWTNAATVSPQGSVSNSWVWSVPVGDAPHCLFAVVDPANEIDEFIEGNNTGQLDCVLADLAAVRAAGEWVVGSTYQLKAEVANHGTVSAGAFDLDFRVGSPTGALAGTLLAPGLAAGWTNTWTVEWDADGVSLPTSLWVHVVAETDWVEFGTNDNVAFFGVTPPEVGIPGAPADLTARGGAARIHLRWLDQGAGEDGYRILRSTGDTNWDEVAYVPSNTVACVDTSVVADVAYTYEVFAYNVNGSGERSDQAAARAWPDVDGDGMADAWEEEHFGSITNSAGGQGEDWDGDGSCDRAEYAAGTNPTNGASALAMIDGARVATNEFVIEWSSVEDRFYTLERGTNLLQSASFSTIGSALPATAPMNTYTDRTEAIGRAFYRVHLDE